MEYINGKMVIKYTGKWKYDMKKGKGNYEYFNQDIYEGFFKNDKIDEKWSIYLGK